MSFVKLSASAIKTYTDCAKKYYFRYIEKLPSLEKDYFVLGKFCHSVLEDFHNAYNDSEKKDVQILGPLMSESFKNNRKKYAVTEDQLKDSKKMLTLYLHKYEKSGMSNTIGTEVGFTYELDNETNPDEPFLLRGSIDRLDLEDDGTYSIIDWKTTKKTSIKYMDDFQLGVYAVYIRRKYGAKKIRAGYQFLKDKSNIKWYEFTDADIDQMERKIQKDGKLIITDTKWKTNVTKLCSYCDYYKQCSNRWG